MILCMRAGGLLGDTKVWAGREPKTSLWQCLIAQICMFPFHSYPSSLEYKSHVDGFLRKIIGQKMFPACRWRFEKNVNPVLNSLWDSNHSSFWLSQMCTLRELQHIFWLKWFDFISNQWWMKNKEVKYPGSNSTSLDFHQLWAKSKRSDIL